jgi:hypothetical protein
VVDLEQRAENGGQVNQAAPRFDVQVSTSALPQVFDAQIIQPRGAFDDGFRLDMNLSKSEAFISLSGLW